MTNTEQELSTRERILAAAAAIISEEGVTARLSVRAVAGRAGVSTGSLRHHFPTQHELREELMRRIYDWMVPDDRIHDAALPARDRLVECLRQVLAQAGIGQEARAAMVTVTRSFIDVEQTEQVRAAYLTMASDGHRRIADWLGVLAAEGALPAEDVGRRARFLMTVLNGLGLERALPAEDSMAQLETATLYFAADSVLDAGQITSSGSASPRRPRPAPPPNGRDA